MQIVPGCYGDLEIFLFLKAFPQTVRNHQSGYFPKHFVLVNVESMIAFVSFQQHFTVVKNK